MFNGKGILLLTPFEFRLCLSSSDTFHISGIKENSPTYNFFKKHFEIFKNFSIDFYDPYKSQEFLQKISKNFSYEGGFGSSSAAFALIYKAYLEITKCEFCLDKYYEDFLESSKAKDTIYKPSGADICSQYANNHIIFDGRRKTFENIKLNLKNFGIAIFKTGVKVNTHEHIIRLNSIDPSKLNFFANKAIEAILELKNQENQNFLIKNLADSINNFYNEAQKLGIVIESTKKWIDVLMTIDGVLAAKGCGALFADSIVLLFEINKRDIVFEKTKNLDLYLIHVIS